MISVSKIQETLDEKSMLISYFIANRVNRIYIFQISQKSFNVLNISRHEKLTGYIRGLRNAIKYSIDKSYKKTASFLYQQLFPYKLPKSIQQIILIPDGELNRIPFDALLTEELEKEMKEYEKFPFLLKKWLLSYAYSATLFYQTSQKENLNKSREILLCAPIEFQDANSLESTLDEVNLIEYMSQSESWDVKKFTYKDANENMIKSGVLKNKRIVHFATHGSINESSPELSRIYLAPHPDSGEDGNLFVGELYNLDMTGSDLATLSACQTGLGKLSKGEGIIGLTRALFYAGVRNLLVSLWSVNDEATSQLMAEFYKHYFDEGFNTGNYSKSLQKAKLTLIERGYGFPYYWASFIMIGE